MRFARHGPAVVHTVTHRYTPLHTVTHTWEQIATSSSMRLVGNRAKVRRCCCQLCCCFEIEAPAPPMPLPLASDLAPTGAPTDEPLKVFVSRERLMVGAPDHGRV